MRSVGMSQKQLSVMVHKEGLIVVGMGLVLSVIIGGGIGYVLCSFLKNNLMSYLQYQFPWPVVLIYLAILLMVQFILISYTTGNLKKQSLVEQIRAME